MIVPCCAQPASRPNAISNAKFVIILFVISVLVSEVVAPTCARSVAIPIPGAPQGVAFAGLG